MMLDWVSETIKNKRDCILPAKTSIHLEGNKFYNTMPCVIPALNAAGVKLVNRYPDNHPSLKAHLMLYNLASGNLEAIMDASYITSMRTAAVGVHSIRLFAKKDYQTVAFIGLGEVGKLTLKIFVETLNGRKVTIRLFNYKERGQGLIDQYKSYKNITWELYNNFEEMIRDCDVIVSAVTYQENDFTTPDKYKKGCLLVPIHTRGFTECDLVFDKIFGDDTTHIQGFKYFNQYKKFVEITDVVNGRVHGRESDEESIICYSIGIAIHDLAFAKKILELLDK